MPFESSRPNSSADAALAAEPSSNAGGFRELDQQLRGRFAQLSGGQSPWAALQAWEDWAFHLGVSPGKQAELYWGAVETCLAIGKAAWGGASAEWAVKPEPDDRRFRGEAWRQPPFNLFAQLQLAAEAQWRTATSGVRGVADHHARRVEFLGRFLLNALAPLNFAWTNPEVLEAAARTGGANFAAGAALFAEDLTRLAQGRKLKGMEDWKVGETMALTPGRVIFRNELMELIQYAPTTPTVYREPILIVPAWIMKYCILDLTPEESLVRYLVGQGYTVFIISWKNPTRDLRETSFDDYRHKGVLAALEAVGKVIPKEKVHGVGYCLGGTVLAIAAAAMDRDGDDRLASLTLLAAQTDFEEAGELMMFIDESQLALLEDMMHVEGFLDARKMASAFYALRANELLFSRLVERYLIGQPTRPKALDAWLVDPTRMPSRMHGEYLRRLFMHNEFAHGQFKVDGQAVALKDIRTPIFALGAERDHIAPWRSVHKIELYGSAKTTFVLTGGGHNTSVVSPPGKARAYYYVGHAPACGDYVDPDAWLATAQQQPGSWWPTWSDWLADHSSADRVPPPAMGRKSGELKPREPAPGLYVLEK